MVVTAQKTRKKVKKKDCDEAKQGCLEYAIVPVYSLQTYKEKEGYKYWFNLTEQENSSLIDINSRLRRKPSFYAPKCNYELFSGLKDLILAAMRV